MSEVHLYERRQQFQQNDLNIEDDDTCAINEWVREREWVKRERNRWSKREREREREWGSYDNAFCNSRHSKQKLMQACFDWVLGIFPQTNKLGEGIQRGNNPCVQRTNLEQWQPHLPMQSLDGVHPWSVSIKEDRRWRWWYRSTSFW